MVLFLLDQGLLEESLGVAKNLLVVLGSGLFIGESGQTAVVLGAEPENTSENEVEGLGTAIPLPAQVGAERFLLFLHVREGVFAESPRSLKSGVEVLEFLLEYFA